MRVLVTGAGGMLAHTLVPMLREARHEVLALGSRELDVTDEAAVTRCIDGYRPDAVVQCAAFTAVDRAESEEEHAHRVNAEGTRFVARACQKVGSVLVYPSTDYVFAGDGARPYRTDDPTGPINAYGRSKLAGEQAAWEAGRALVVRTSWLYGPGGANFVDTILRLAAEREFLDVVDDQIGRPTSTQTLSRVILELLKSGAGGTFHVTDGGEPVTWYGFARSIVDFRKLSVALRAVSASSFARPARRPAYSVLDCRETEGALGERMPDWRRTLADYLSR